MTKKPPFNMALWIGIVLPLLAMLLALSYLAARTIVVILSDYAWPDRIVAWMLLFAETFILIHGLGYFLEIIHVAHRKGLASREAPPPALFDYPPVAIIVSSFKEPLSVVEETLISFRNQTYPNRRLYFLDDTRYDLPGPDPQEMALYRQAIDDLCKRLGVNLFRRRWRGAKAGMINDFLDFIEGNPREGFEFHSFAKGPRPEDKETYIIVFDADSIPMPNFTDRLVARIEADPRLAFVQTPQYYSNFEKNRIAHASGLQQAVFYEYICEGKSIQDAMFCCGTNVIFRREALLDIGGFDESSVTEDFATSLKFHMKGWRSSYYNDVLTFQLGPEDLGGFFKRQFRWALGTIGLLRQIVAAFVRNPRRLPVVKWWEYFLSSTHYFIGLVFLILVSCPILYLFFDVPAYFARPEIYLLLFLPYLMLTLATFYWTLKERRYRPRDLILGQLLMAVTFPVYIKAAVLALLGVRGTFVVTPKGNSTALPHRDLWVQLTLAILAFAAIVWGLNRLISGDGPPAALIVNMVWCLYHFLILASVLYFNEPQAEDPT